MKYDNYRYIYPPRPKNAVSVTDLNFWDNGTLIAQPKLNGTNLTIYTDGVRVVPMNRHGQRISNFKLSDSEITRLCGGKVGKWFVINGEYMNKGKINESGINFNDKFIIFDILVHDSNYLIGKTFQERRDLLNSFFDTSPQSTYLDFVTENIFKVKTYDSGFYSKFTELSKIDMIEGLVLKRKNAKLEIGNTENNNTKSQLKCRKPTKNYKY